MPTFLARLDLTLPRCVRSTDCSFGISAQTQREPDVSFNQDSLSRDRIYLVFACIDLVIYKGQPGCSSIGLALGPLAEPSWRRPLL